MDACVVGTENVKIAIAIKIGNHNVVRTGLGQYLFPPRLSPLSVDEHAHLIGVGTLMHFSNSHVHIAVFVKVADTQ